MHLFIWRPKADEDSADPFFGPYISMLPRDFSSHPLTWLVLSKLNKADDLRISLLGRALTAQEPSEGFEVLHGVMNFLWAWLNGILGSHIW